MQRARNPARGRVLYLLNTYPVVSATFIRREIHALERLGLEVVRVSIRPSAERLVDPADRAEAARTVAILRRGPAALLPGALALAASRPRRWLRGLRRALRLSRGGETSALRHVAYFLEACWLTRFAAREGLRHVHAHFATNAAAVALLAKELGGPGFSFTMHNLADDEQGRRLKLGEKVGEARFTVAISEYGREQTARLSAPECSAKIRIVRCGLDEEGFAGEPTPPSDGPDLLFVGRLCKEKQPLMLIEAAARLAAEGVPFRLRIAGGGELEEAVRIRVAEAGLGRSVALLGAVDNRTVRAELEACRALVLPSYTEGLPLVLVEALARRRPVIASRITGIPELVRDGQEGWLVPHDDVAALARAMLSALRAPREELARLGASGARRARERHHVDDSARQLLALFAPFCSPDPADRFRLARAPEVATAA